MMSTMSSARVCNYAASMATLGLAGAARGACGTQARAPAGRRQAAWSILRSLSFLCSARWAMLR